MIARGDLLSVHGSGILNQLDCELRWWVVNQIGIASIVIALWAGQILSRNALFDSIAAEDARWTLCPRMASIGNASISWTGCPGEKELQEE